MIDLELPLAEVGSSRFASRERPMGDDSIQRIQQLYLDALELNPEERSAFLAKQCGEDDTLRTEVESLLEFAEEAGDFLESRALYGVDDAFEQLALDGRDDEAGTQMGPYRLREKIGSGGMGTVWLAERVDAEFERTVAIKLIKRGMDTDGILRRFHNERQLLAALEHPHIARLLDGGRTSDGRPYLVMERIEGLRVDEFCEERELDPRERLGLFLQVCDAVHHAHRNLVVHRDLKPSNILVTSDGQAKLLDFGIARLLPAEGHLTTAELTATDSRLLTPRYASPEQVRGETLTTASDVYSLGVILFEILTGRAPYRLTSRARGECERAVCEQAPPRPSDAVSSTRTGRASASATELLAVTATETMAQPRWRRVLRGDLDNIVLKALRKETDRRYTSVDQFAGDIRAYLEGRPVSARPDTLVYRATKFVRRNRVLVGSTFAIMIALTAGFVSSYRAYSRESRALGQAQRQQQIAEETVGFLERMLAGVKPSTALGRDVTVLREILEEAALELEAAPGGRPEVIERIASTIGSVYLAIGDAEQSERFTRLAIENARAVHGDHHPRVARGLSQLGSALADQGRYREAIDLQREAVAIREEALGSNAPEIALSLNELALALKRAGEYEEAESLYRRSLELTEAHHGEESLQTASILHNLAVLLRVWRSVPEAGALLERVVAIRRVKLPPNHYSLSVSLQALADIKTTLGDLNTAIDLSDEATRIQGHVLGAGHPRRAAGLQSAARALATAGRLPESIERYREAIGILRAAYEGNHPETARALSNLAVTLARRHQHHQESETLHREALAMRRALYPNGHADTAVSLDGLAGLLSDQHRLTESGSLYDEALQIRRAVFPDEHPLIVRSMHNLAHALHRRGEFEEAESRARESLALHLRVLPENDPRTALSHLLLGRILLEDGNAEESEPALRRAVEMYTQKYGDTHSYTARSRSFLGLSLVRLSRFEEAERELEAGRTVLEERMGKESAWTRQAAHFLDILESERRGASPD